MPRTSQGDLLEDSHPDGASIWSWRWSESRLHNNDDSRLRFQGAADKRARPLRSEPRPLDGPYGNRPTAAFVSAGAGAAASVEVVGVAEVVGLPTAADAAGLDLETAAAAAAAVWTVTGSLILEASASARAATFACGVRAV
eukprot:1093290-Prorocentrum_minimum.AAC.1